MIRKLAAVERGIAAENGPFDFFAFMLREDAPSRWDLIVSATWLPADKRAALHYLASRLNKTLAKSELVLISRILILAPRDRFIVAVRDALDDSDGIREVSGDFAGVHVREGVVIAARVPARRSRL